MGIKKELGYSIIVGGGVSYLTLGLLRSLVHFHLIPGLSLSRLSFGFDIHGGYWFDGNHMVIDWGLEDVIGFVAGVAMFIALKKKRVLHETVNVF